MALDRITPCLWFDHQAEQAAEFYVSIFPNSKMGRITRYTEVGREFHQKEPGSVMTVDFELNGNPFTGLNGGPLFQFSEAVSFQIFCDSQEEVDHYYERLTDGGTPQPCGWVKDRFGVSWQVIPKRLFELLGGPDADGARRATEAMFRMQKIDIAALERAYAG